MLEGAGALVPLLQVHSLAADDAGHARFAHEHALAHADGRVDAADGHVADEAVVADVLDHEADLVHVRGDHDRGCALLLAALPGHDAAHGVDRDLVAVGRGLVDDEAAHLALVAGDAAQAGKFL